MISKKHGVNFYSDQSIPIEQYVLGVSDIVNSDHIIAASRMRSDVVIFVSSLEDVDTICSHSLSVNGRFFEAQCLVNIPKKLTLSNCPPFLPNTILEDMLINVGQIVSQIKPIPLGIKNPALRHVKSFRRQVSILMKSPQDQIPAFFDISFQKQNYRIFVNDDVTCFKCKQHGHLQRKYPMNQTDKLDTVNDLHKPDNHSEKVYEAEALQTAFSHSWSNTENLATLNSTPSSTPVSTTEPKLTIQTEDVPDKAATSVSVVQSTDYLSTTNLIHPKLTTLNLRVTLHNLLLNLMSLL
jgi:hypothetical protein